MGQRASVATHIALSSLATLDLLFDGYKLHIEFLQAISHHFKGIRQMRQRFLMYKVRMFVLFLPIFRKYVI